MTLFLADLGFNMTTHAGIFWFGVAWTAFAISVIWIVGYALEGHHGMIDAFYGYGFAMQIWIAYYFSGATSATATAILLMGSLHSCRLGFYLSKRWYGYRNKGTGDQRYMSFVPKLSPGYWWKSFLIVLQPQTAMITLGCLAATWGILANDASHPAPLNFLSVIGILIFGIGFYFETVADGQLQAFKADPNNKGHYLNTGVWTYSRHPNYFGNVTVWWGIYLVAVAGNPDYWWVIVGPIVNTILLTSVVGRAFQDKFMGGRPEYKKLMARTNGFLPIPPRKQAR
jgi:steroid 5-alpha reductase family enzyme